MANVKISDLTSAALPLTGTEQVPVVQSGNTVKTTVQDIANKASLGYTAENVANKSINTALGTSDTLYPTQNAVKVYVDGSVAGLLDDRGSYTPSVTSPGAYPSTGGSGTAGAIMKGDLWFMSASGFLGTTAVAAGATVRALVNTPGQTAANWNILSAGAISITTPTLQQVTTAGATSTNNININSDGGAFVSVNAISDSGKASLNALLGQGGSVQITNTFNSIGTIKANNLGANRTYQLPDASGTLALTSDIGLPYKVCVLNMNYSAGAWSIENTFQNTIGTINLTSISNQRFSITSTGNFTLGKVAVLPMLLASQSGSKFGILDSGLYPPTIDDITIRISDISTGNIASASTKGGGVQWILEIRVYP